MLGLVVMAASSGLLGLLVLGLVFGILCLEGLICWQLYNYIIVDGIFKGGTTFKKLDNLWQGIALYAIITLYFRNATVSRYYAQTFQVVQGGRIDLRSKLSPRVPLPEE